MGAGRADRSRSNIEASDRVSHKRFALSLFDILRPRRIVFKTLSDLHLDNVSLHSVSCLYGYYSAPVSVS